jgi:HEAT repeat protein
VAALRELRRVEGGRTRAVAESLLGLLDTAADPSLRADICRQLHRAVPPDLKGPLLRRLRADADARVREEAAETLGPLKEDPEVRAALEDAARSDAEEKVRSQAARSLSGRR